LERLLAQVRGEGLPAEGEVFDQRSGRWFAVGVYPTGRTSAEGGRLFLCTAWETGEGRRTREERDLWALAVEQATDSIMITDQGARILYVNAAFERLAGVSRDEALGQTCPLLCSPLPSSPPLPSAAELTAARRERAFRRTRELRGIGIRTSALHQYIQLGRRDRLDSSRENSPLRPAWDATVIDSTLISPAEVAECIIALYRARQGRG